VFFGQHTKALDDKHRIIIPSEYRKAVKEKGAGKPGEFFLTITPGKGRCLSLFTVEQFNKLFMQFDPDSSFNNEDMQDYARFIAGYSHLGVCDKQGRYAIPTNLREDVGIQKEVVLVGVITHVEIWDSGMWKQYNIEKRASISEVTRRIRREQSGDEN